MAAVSISDCRRAAAAAFNISEAELLKTSKARKFAWPRIVAMAVAREFTGKSYPVLAREFKRDHTTVIYAIRRAKQLENSKPEFKVVLDNIRAVLTQQLVLAKTGIICEWCGRYHKGTCPKVRSIEYYPDGRVKHVELRLLRPSRAKALS